MREKRFDYDLKVQQLTGQESGRAHCRKSWLRTDTVAELGSLVAVQKTDLFYVCELLHSRPTQITKFPTPLTILPQDWWDAWVLCPPAHYPSQDSNWDHCGLQTENLLGVLKETSFWSNKYELRCCAKLFSAGSCSVHPVHLYILKVILNKRHHRDASYIFSIAKIWSGPLYRDWRPHSDLHYIRVRPEELHCRQQHMLFCTMSPSLEG